MIRNHFSIFIFAILFSVSLSFAVAQSSYDVIVYGATPSGILAAVAAANEGMNTLLIHPLKHVGGMVTGGLGQTDVGNSAVIGGGAKDFFIRVGKAYGHTNGEPQFTFEPHVAEQVFMDLINEQSKLTLVTEQTLASTTVQNTVIQSLSVLPSSLAINLDPYTPLSNLLSQNQTLQSFATTYSAKVFLDASYEGDLLGSAGVSFVVGRESVAQYNESVNGRLFVPNHYGGHQFGVPVNYTWPNGTILPLIYTGDPGQVGQGDNKVEAYNFRMCLTTNVSNRVPIPAPTGYDPSMWELFRRYLVAANITSIHEVMNISPMPNSKTDINNNGAISTDVIGASWEWPLATPARRAQLWTDHRTYTQGFFYFLGNDPAVPASMRQEMLEYGFPKDEFVDNGGWPWQLYVREARRMVSTEFLFTQGCREQTNFSVPDSIGLLSYNSDTHNAQRFPQGEYVRNEGDVEMFGNLGPGQMPFRMTVPSRNEITNLIVPVSVSATHIGFGAIRLEPQWLILGQSCGVAAAQAITSNVAVQDISIAQLQARLIELKQLLVWTGE